MRPAIAAILEMILLAAVTGCASTPYDFEVNPTPTVRPSATKAEADRRIAAFEDCMMLAGWLTVETASGKAFKYDDSQQSAFMSANSECLESSGLDEPIGAMPSSKESYRSMVNMHACLRQAGFDLEDPPSFQAFDDAGSRWTPYEEILVTDLAKAEKVCPQNGF